MTNRQIAKNNMYNQMVAFFAKPANAAIWAAFARLVTEIANFVSLKQALDLFIQQQALNTKGVTASKNADFNAMIEQIVMMTGKAFVWAVDNSNETLTELFDVGYEDFDGQAEEVAFAKVMNIRNAINTDIAGMASVNLLPADVTDLDNLIAAYNLSKGTAGDAESHKQTGTLGVKDQMHEIDASLNLIGRLIISQYSSSNPGMVSDFKFDRRIDDLPTHHSGIHTHITDALTGEDIEGAILSIPAAGKSATSDINGIAEIIKIKNGDYHVNVTFPGYQSQSFKTKIIRGKITSFEIKLSTASGGGGVTAIREGDVTSPGTANIDVEGIKATPLTQLIILVAGSALRFYASATPGGILGPEDPFIDVQPGTHYQKQLDEFIALIGLNETKKYLTVQNIGMTTGHYTITFDNLEA